MGVIPIAVPLNYGFKCGIHSDVKSIGVCVLSCCNNNSGIDKEEDGVQICSSLSSDVVSICIMFVFSFVIMSVFVDACVGIGVIVMLLFSVNRLNL